MVYIALSEMIYGPAAILKNFHVSRSSNSTASIFISTRALCRVRIDFIWKWRLGGNDARKKLETGRKWRCSGGKWLWSRRKWRWSRGKWPWSRGKWQGSRGKWRWSGGNGDVWMKMQWSRVKGDGWDMTTTGIWHTRSRWSGWNMTKWTTWWWEVTRRLQRH